MKPVYQFNISNANVLHAIVMLKTYNLFDNTQKFIYLQIFSSE